MFELGQQQRHHVSASVTYLPMKWAGFTLEYEYGSLPPTFVFTDHTVTLMLKTPG